MKIDALCKIIKNFIRKIIVNLKISWDEIEKYVLDKQTYRIINHESDVIDEKLKQLNMDYYNIQDYIRRFWQFGFDFMIIKLEDKRKKINRISSLSPVRYQTQLSESKKNIIIKLEFFQTFLKLTKICVDLGYTEKDLNDLILLGVFHIFSVFNKEEINERSHWIASFMANLKDINYNNEYNSYLDRIFSEAASILKIFSNIKTHIQIIM